MNLKQWACVCVYVCVFEKGLIKYTGSLLSLKL